MDAQDSPQHLIHLLGTSLADHAHLSRIVFSGPLKGKGAVTTKVIVRPVRIAGRILFQVSTHDEKKVVAKNHDLEPAMEIACALSSEFRSITILKTDGTVQLERLADGRTRITRSRAQVPAQRLDRFYPMAQQPSADKLGCRIL